MKSIIRRPSDSLPAGFPKKLAPYGGGMGPNAADIPPVSEFASPKLYTAGKSHGGARWTSLPAASSNVVDEMHMIVNSSNFRYFISEYMRKE